VERTIWSVQPWRQRTSIGSRRIVGDGGFAVGNNLGGDEVNPRSPVMYDTKGVVVWA